MEALRLGPVQTILHEPIKRPWVRRRLGQVLDSFGRLAPTIVHAMCADAYPVATAVAETFDADLILQVTSLADCDTLSQANGYRNTRFIALSQPLADMLQSRLGIAADRIDLIRPGVLASQRVACFAEADHMPTILCTSALDNNSGVERLISALTILRERGHTLFAFLLGSGRQESFLRRMVREGDLSSNVTFADPAGDTTQAMQSADVFVVPASSDAFRVDALQAMGAGMAVVTLPCAVCDHFHDGKTAVVCRSSTAAALATAVERFLKDHAYARQVAGGGLEYVRTHHAMSVMAERTASVYRKLAITRATFSIGE